MTALIQAVWISFRRSGGFLFTVLFFAWLAILFAAVLNVQGDFMVNGTMLDLNDTMRMNFAVGLGVKSTALFGMLFLLFHGAAMALSDAERGSALFDLTAPISRARYLAGRSLGLLSILAAIWAASLLFFQLLLIWRLGEVRGSLVVGAFLIFFSQAILAGLLILFRLLMRGGWGNMGGLAVWIAGWALSHDLLEAYLFDVGTESGDGGWLIPLMQPYIAGEPAGPAAALARLVVRLFPPMANAQSVGLDVALGKEVFPSIDWWSLPAGAVWFGIFWGGLFLLFRRKDL